MGIIVWLFIGAIAGWLAGPDRLGLRLRPLWATWSWASSAPSSRAWSSLTIGLGFGGGILAAILHATIGAVIFLFLVKVIKRA